MPGLALRRAQPKVTVFNPHTLHRSDNPDECPECEILDKHRQRWKEALAEGPVGLARQAAMAEQHRQDWLAWNQTEVVETTKHDKLKRIAKFATDHHGETATLKQIMEAIDAAAGTVYSYIREMPLVFRRAGTSLYHVSDPVRARLEAATLPQDRLESSGASSATGPIIPSPARQPSKP